MQKWTVRDGMNLRDFLSLNLATSKRRAKEIIDSRNVFVNNRRVWIATHTLKKDDTVEVHELTLEKKSPEVKKAQIIFEDDYVIAVNKPASILSDAAEGSMEDILRNQMGSQSIRAIHRLDRDTSGALLFAKNNAVFEKFKDLWQDKEIEKVYLAISHNEADFKLKKVDKDVDDKKALSYVKLLSKRNGFSYFEITIITGRKHQVRIHLASIRHPIAGDAEYGLKTVKNDIVKSIRRQMLHSYTIAYTCPFTGQPRRIQAAPPKDFVSLLKKMDMD